MRVLPMYHLAATRQKARYLDEEPDSVAHHHATGVAQPVRASFGTRVRAAIRVLRREHSLTDHPCHLPDGRIGRVAVVENDGEWLLVCRVA